MMNQPDPVTLPPGSVVPELEQWKAWTPSEAAAVLSCSTVPWYVAGGWAIDLFLGEQRRHHEDLEVGVPAERFGEMADALSSYELFVAGGVSDVGMVWPLDGAEWTLAEHHQTWVQERSTGYWRMDVFREPSRDGRWVCRRHAGITLAYEDLVMHTEDGIPFARPEVVLLFKAKRQLLKDEAEFAAVVPLLPDDARARLAEWLELVHPEHHWISALSQGAATGSA